jgi:predicted solute-binding protein
MNAIMKLTDRERKYAIDALFEDNRKQLRFVLEALSDMNNETGTLWLNAYINRDYYFMGEMQDRAVREYQEATGMNETELSEARGRKELE